MKTLLRNAIEGALGDGSLTYRQITDIINGRHLYTPADGMLVAGQQVRSCVRENARLFAVDKDSTPHRVSKSGIGILRHT